jgi:carbamoyltransferase
LENSELFKRACCPGLTDREYRTCQGYDVVAALVVDGSIVAAAAEERFTGRKHTGALPLEAIPYGLSETGLSWADIDELVHALDYSPYRAFAFDPVTAHLSTGLIARRILAHVSRRLPDFPTERVRHGHIISRMPPAPSTRPAGTSVLPLGRRTWDASVSDGML